MEPESFEKDAHVVLGVRRDPPPAETCRAYLCVMKAAHPDGKTGGAWTLGNATAAEANAAHNQLKDPDERRRYDLHLAGRRPPAAAAAAGRARRPRETGPARWKDKAGRSGADRGLRLHRGGGAGRAPVPPGDRPDRVAPIPSLVGTPHGRSCTAAWRATGAGGTSGGRILKPGVGQRMTTGQPATGRRTVPGYDGTSIHWMFINPDGTPDEDMLARVTASIVESIDPEKIVLFGSAARGEMNERSDIDLLVITKTGDGRAAAAKARAGLPRKRRGADIVVVTEDDVERNRWKPYFVIEPALREGRVLHEKNGTDSRRLADMA